MMALCLGEYIQRKKNDEKDRGEEKGVKETLNRWDVDI